LVWIVDPVMDSVFAYHSLTDARRFSGEDQVIDEEILPGFSLLVHDLFKD
jgi:hypothetical protein